MYVVEVQFQLTDDITCNTGIFSIKTRVPVYTAESLGSRSRKWTTTVALNEFHAEMQDKRIAHVPTQLYSYTTVFVISKFKTKYSEYGIIKKRRSA